MLNIEGEILKGFEKLGWPLRAEVETALMFVDSLQTFLKVAAPATQNNNCVSPAINRVAFPLYICII